jgi:hypothetical protein
MANVGNWVSEICNTIGVGDIVLAGGYQGQVSFAKAFDAGPVYYSVLDNGNRECGTGTFNGTTGLVRDTITATYENGVYNDVNPTAITLSGTAVVSCTYNASAFDDQVIDAALAVQSADAASTSESNASTSENNASSSETAAYNWAVYVEDSLVPEGNLVDEYSSLHHATKAATSETNASNSATESENSRQVSDSNKTATNNDVVTTNNNASSASNDALTASNAAGLATTEADRAETEADGAEVSRLAAENAASNVVNTETGVSSSYTASVAVGGTTFTLSSVSIKIKSDQGLFELTYAGATNVTVANLSASSTYVYIDNAGNLQQQTSTPTRQDWVRKVFTMRIGVDTNTNLILGFEYLNNPVGSFANSIRDIYAYLLAQGIPFKKDQVITGRAGDLGFDVSSGSLLEFGGTGDIYNPNIRSFSAVTNTSYTLLSKTAVVSVETDLVKFWDNAGTITALGSTTVVGHRLYRFSDGNFAIQYGQGNYANMTLAKAGALIEEYELNPKLKNATFFGWWFIEETASNTGGTTLTEFKEYTIGIQGGSSSGLAGCMLIGNNGTDILDVNAFLINIGAAPLDSPELTGTPTAPTAATATDDTQVATTEFTRNAIAAYASTDVAAEMAGATVNNVGSYILATSSNTTSPNGTRSGSTLNPTSVAGTTTNYTLSGTWRCMGNNSSGTGTSGTLWLRIS